MQCNFSVGGIIIQGDGSIPSATYLFSLGCVKGLESIRVMSNYPPLDETATMTGIVGLVSYADKMDDIESSQHNFINSNFGVVTAMVDWNWLEKMAKFVIASRDIEPKRILLPLVSEDLLVKAVSTESGGKSNVSLLMEFDKMSLTIPVQVAKDKKDKQVIIATIDSLLVKFGNPHDSIYEEPECGPSTAAENVPSYDHLLPYQARKRSSTVDAISPIYFSSSMDTPDDKGSGWVSLVLKSSNLSIFISKHRLFVVYLTYIKRFSPAHCRRH